MLTPDGERYLALAQHQRINRPFNLRWFLPAACGTNERAWRYATAGGAVLAALGVGLLAPGWKTGLAAGLMMLALPMVRFNLRHPVLVDMAAMGLGVTAAAFVSRHQDPLTIGVAVALSLWAGMVKETTPVFAAAWAWNPWLLLGLLAPAYAFLRTKTGPDPRPDLAWIQDKPFRAGWMFHKDLYLTGMMLAPWGGAIVGLANMDWHLAVVLALAYGQLLIATDTVRLYQWAAPTLIVAAVTAVPPIWLPVLVAWTIWNPLASEGV